MMKRRDFINWVGLGWLASSLPVAIAACSPQAETSSSPSVSPSDSPTNPTTGGEFKPADTIPALDKAGFLKANLDSKSIVIIRDPDNKTKILALGSVCPHKGCQVDWKEGEKKFVCPCHGSKFAPNGKVLEGPASKPLPVYPVKLDGSTILVKPA